MVDTMTEPNATPTGQEPGGEPSQSARFAQELDAKNRRIAELEEENRLRRLRELRLYEAEEASRNQQANARHNELVSKLDPEVRNVLDAYIDSTVGRRLQQVESNTAEVRSRQAVVDDMNWLQANVPYLHEVGPDMHQYLKSLPEGEREAALSNRSHLAFIAKTIKTAKDAIAGKGVQSDAKARMASERGSESGTTRESAQPFNWDTATEAEKNERRQWIQKERLRRGRQ